MSFVPQKPPVDITSIPAMPHFTFGEFAELYPATAWYWSSSTWPDGTLKRSARVTLAIFQGRLQVQLQLLGTGLMLRLELIDPVTLWDALEAALTLEVVPWERDPWVPADKPRDEKPRGKKGG